jgi:hypothetical protein
VALVKRIVIALVLVFALVSPLGHRWASPDGHRWDAPTVTA